MSFKDLLNFEGNNNIFEECDGSQSEPILGLTDEEEETRDVFVGLDVDCRSELSSLSESESKVSDSPEKPIRKQLVIGKHIQITEGEYQKYTCLICNCSFSRKQQVRYHDYCVSGKRPLKCDLCGKGFVKKAHLVYHQRTHTGETPFKCSICKKGFKQKAKLTRHEKTHESESRLSCTYCKKLYSDKDSLRKHEQKHNEKVYNCPTCKKSYSDKFTLKQHMAVHKSPNYICDVCGKSFLRKNSLNVHKQIHEDIYPLECMSCHRTFRNRKELNHHSVVHEKNNPGHECDICSITCGRKDNLLRHIRNCHLDPCQKKSLKESKDNDIVKEQNIQQELSGQSILKSYSSSTTSDQNEKRTEGRIECNEKSSVCKPKVTGKKGNVPSSSKLIVKLFSPSNSKEEEDFNPNNNDLGCDAEMFSKTSQKGKNEPSLKNWKRLKTNNGEIVPEENNSSCTIDEYEPMKIHVRESFNTSVILPECRESCSISENNSGDNEILLSCSQNIQLGTPNVLKTPSEVPDSVTDHELTNTPFKSLEISQQTSVIMHTDLFKASVIAANALRDPVIKSLRVPIAPQDNFEEPNG